MPARLELQGNTFGRLTVKSMTDEIRRGRRVWHCECECGGTIDAIASELVEGRVSSCGCKRLATDESLRGERFGSLTVLREEPGRDGFFRIWWCKCDCGKFCRVNTGKLRSGLRTKCIGCSTVNNRYIDFVGKKFGLLKVIVQKGLNNRRYRLWECQCECGNITIVPTGELVSGNTISCGCRRVANGVRRLPRLKRHCKRWLKETETITILGKQWLAPREFCKQLGIDKSTAQNWREYCPALGRKVVSRKPPGSNVRYFSAEDLELILVARHSHSVVTESPTLIISEIRKSKRELGAKVETGIIVTKAEGEKTRTSTAAVVGGAKVDIIDAYGLKAEQVAEPDESNVIFWHGDDEDGPSYSYSHGSTGTPKSVSREMNSIFEHFLEAGHSLNTKQLSGAAANISAVMGKIEKKFPGTVTFPPTKNDGYFISVKKKT